MYLLRVKVPDFRVLKGIDLTFEKDFVPPIFPLGSLNGGGKSTLLQLIFILLHCGGDRSKHQFIQNLLCRYFPHLNPEEGPKTLAQFWVYDGQKTYTLEFFVYRNSALKSLLKPQHLNPAFLPLYYFSGLAWLGMPEDNLNAIAQQIKTYLDTNHYAYITDYQLDLKGYGAMVPGWQSMEASGNQSPKSLPGELREGVLFCKIDGLTSQETLEFLARLSPHIFLAAPSTQVFLFSSLAHRKRLFQLHQGYPDFSQDMSQEIGQDYGFNPQNLDHFFPYHFLSMNFLMGLFQKARDQDFAYALQQHGTYGEESHVKRLFEDLSEIVDPGVMVRVNPELTEAIFEVEENDRFIRLQPEDLSHGELKRLSIFLWLKYYNLQNAIVLMDEPEIAFHPDWQYQIVQDLLDWSPQNQYILATHSYEICQALTPAHVKEIDLK